MFRAVMQERDCLMALQGSHTNKSVMKHVGVVQVNFDDTIIYLNPCLYEPLRQRIKEGQKLALLDWIQRCLLLSLKHIKGELCERWMILKQRWQALETGKNQMSGARVRPYNIVKSRTCFFDLTWLSDV